MAESQKMSRGFLFAKGAEIQQGLGNVIGSDYGLKNFIPMHMVRMELPTRRLRLRGTDNCMSPTV